MTEEINLNEYYFNVEFPTSIALRQILEFIHQSHNEVPLSFRKNNFVISKINGEKNMIFEAILDNYNFFNYYVDPKKLKESSEDNPDNEPEYVINIKVPVLITNLKKIPKKKKLRICQRKDNPDFITVYGYENDSKTEIRLDISKEKPKQFETENYIPSCNPNKTISLSHFNYSSTGVSDRITKIKCYKYGVEISSTSIQGDSCVSAGNTLPEDLINEIQIPGVIIKSISKLATLCDESIVRVYSNNNSYIRLEIPISIMGTAYIYFLNDPLES